MIHDVINFECVGKMAVWNVFLVLAFFTQCYKSFFVRAIFEEDLHCYIPKLLANSNSHTSEIISFSYATPPNSSSLEPEKSNLSEYNILEFNVHNSIFKLSINLSYRLLNIVFLTFVFL